MPRQMFEIKIPSMRIQSAWDDLNGPPSKNKQLSDEFIDAEQAMLGSICRDFAGKKVRVTFETIGK
jgi:hypothetical protein